MTSIFTKIIRREIAADIIHETDELIVISDINPQAKTHLLIIPKKEIPTINDLEDHDRELISNMLFTAKHIAAQRSIQAAYKLQFNV